MVKLAMKHFVLFSLFVVVGVGVWALAPWKSRESEPWVEELAEDCQKKAPIKNSIQASDAEFSLSKRKPFPDESLHTSGAGGRAIPFAVPSLPVTPPVESNGNETRRGNSVTGREEASPVGYSVVSGGAGNDGGAGISSSVYAEGSGVSVGTVHPKATAREISIPVPEGAKVPTLFYDGEQRPIPQQKALDRIAREFEANVSEIPPGMTKEEVWETARSIADERYITLYGYQAFNQYHIQSAKEALSEKRARSNATGP
jgi:hypothetical protein